jgi:hypothetical protein
MAAAVTNSHSSENMKIALVAFALLALTTSGSLAQTPAEPTMAISTIRSVEEVERAIFEIVVVLQSGTVARLRMNAFTMGDLAIKMGQRLGR